MMIDIGKIVGQSDLENDFEGVCERAEREKELIVFRNNKPAYVIMTIEHYESMRGEGMNKDNETEEQSNESLETLLNKIGKKTFVDYYYVFKEDVNPEEKLPDNFTLNSRRSRSSSARKIFKNGLEIAALNNIIQSSRLDDDTLDNAKTILGNEIGNTSATIPEVENEDENDKGNEMKIGKSARIMISKFLQDSVITDEEIQLMQEADYSKRVFNLNFPVLKKIDNNLELNQQKKDQRGYNRYYDTIIPAAGDEYLLCSQWVENLHKSAFENWLESNLMTVIINRVENLESGTEYTIPELLNDYWAYVLYKTRKLLGKKFVEKVRNNSVSNVVELDKKIKNCQVYRKM
jgi:prevent-host-death family protein